MKRTSKKLPAVEQLPSGAFRCRVQVDGERKSFTAETAAEAQRLAMLAKAGERGKTTRFRSKTVAVAIDEFINDRRNILSPTTLRAYNSIRNNRFRTVMDKPIDEITVQAWQQAVNLEAKEVSAKTVRNAWGLMRSVIDAEGLPVPKLRLPQKIKNTRPFLDDEELKVFLKAIEGDAAELPLLLALHSLRTSELLGLRWKDIDLKHGTISVNGALVVGEDNAYVWKKETKNESSRRTVQILIPRLHQLLEESRQPAGQVVTTKYETIYKHSNSICRKAELPEVGLHGLRHTFASLCFFLGIPEKAIMEMGGWSDPTVLRDIYTHISPKLRQIYVDRIKAFFS